MAFIDEYLSIGTVAKQTGLTMSQLNSLLNGKKLPEPERIFSVRVFRVRDLDHIRKAATEAGYLDEPRQPEPPPPDLLSNAES